MSIGILEITKKQLGKKKSRERKGERGRGGQKYVSKMWIKTNK